MDNERARTFWLFIVLCLFVFSIVPILWYQYLPLADYPNHLARLQIQKTLSSDPDLSKFYELSWNLTPYLGFDLLALPFMYFLPVQIVGKIMIVVSFLLIYGGTILLDRQLNPDNWGLSLFSCIFFYNGAVKYGFLPYVVGVGFAICAFWIWVRYRERADGICFFVLVLLTGLVCLMHLYAFGIYAMCVAGYECSLCWERLRVERVFRNSLFKIPLVAALTLVTPVLMLWCQISSSPESIVRGNGAPFWAEYVRNAEALSSPIFLWNVLERKVEALSSPVFYCDPFFEAPLVLIIAGLFVWAIATQTIRVNSRMIIPLAAFAVIFVAMPFGLMGSAYAYYRLPSAIIFIALASFGWGKTSPARINAVRLLLTACLVVRVVSVFLDWQPAQAVIGEYEAALRSVPPGSRLMVVVRRTFWGDRKPPLRHVPVLAAAMQGVFDPRTFTEGVYPLRTRPDYRDYWVDDSTGPSNVNDFKKFEYLMEIRQPSVEVPAGFTLHEIQRGQTFVLYRIEQ